MTKTTPLLMAVPLLIGFLCLSGCSGGKEAGVDAKADMALVKSDLKNVKKARTQQDRTLFLRRAYDHGGDLATRWPDSEELPVFLERYGAELKGIPRQVYALSMQTEDLDSFKWAVARSKSVDLLQHSELLKVWEMGKPWCDHYVAEYPKQTLSIFMSEAVDDYGIRFFNQYIGDFKASAYHLEFPLEKTEFGVRFCRFFSGQIEAAMRKEDPVRLGFLLDHMPVKDSVFSRIDLKTENTMRVLGDYVCHDLKDEALACKLVKLGYDMNRVDLSKAGFGDDFVQVLNANPEHAITHILKINEWHGGLSSEEATFLLSLPDPLLRLIHKQHVADAIRILIKTANHDATLRLVKIREETAPLTSRDYEQLLGWSLEYGNFAVLNYIRTKPARIDVYRLNLGQLAGNEELFRLYAPKIMRKIYRTMDKTPKKDGTTLGRIDDLLTSHHPQAVFYVVKKYDFKKAWNKVSPDGRTLLMAVCEGGNLDAAKYLIERKGADVVAHTDYMEAVTTVFGRSEAKEGRFTPMFFAAKSGNSELIEYLASKGANVNARSAFGATPLMQAVDNNRLEAVQTLISLGANVNAAMDEGLFITSELGELNAYKNVSTAYRRAKRSANQDLLDILKKAGARP